MSDETRVGTGVGRDEMSIVALIALQRHFPTFPVKVIFIEPD